MRSGFGITMKHFLFIETALIDSVKRFRIHSLPKRAAENLDLDSRCLTHIAYTLKRGNIKTTIDSTIMTPDVPAPAVEQPAPVNTPPSTAGMTTKVVKGSLWTLAGQVAPLGVSLVATPFTIRLLGAEGYGVLILVGLIPTYLGFADLGMGFASTKFGSEAYAAGDTVKEARTVRTAAVLFN